MNVHVLIEPHRYEDWSLLVIDDSDLRELPQEFHVGRGMIFDALQKRG